MHITNPGTPDESGVWEEESAKFHACAQKLVALSDPFGRPQARLIQ